MAAPIGLDQIRAAAATLGPDVARTPTVHAARLSAMLDCAVFLKLETLQFTGSFKERGALIKLKSLTAAQANAGVIAMSAGNHGQGVAHHAGRLNIPATIVMPEGTPFGKVERTRQLGAEVVLAGATVAAAAAAAQDIMERDGLTFVHPYDDPKVIAGQGTIAIELLADQPDLEVIVVPIGGGGAIAGIATAAKALKPEIEIVGVQAKLYPSMAQAVSGAAPATGGPTIADGIAVERPGALTRPIVERLVADVVLVDEPALEMAVALLVEAQNLVAEGAGAAPLAAMLADPARFAGRKVGLVVTGGNIDARLLAAVLNRGLVRDGRIVGLRVELVDQPGLLGKVTEVIGTAGGNIIDVYHQRMFYDVPARKAEVDIVIETRNAGHVDEIIAALKQCGVPARILSARAADGAAP